MFVTVVALMCHLIGGNPDAKVCVEEIVTDTDMTPELTFFGCAAMGQPALAKWKGEHPIYRNERWFLSDYKCVPGHYEVKGRA